MNTSFSEQYPESPFSQTAEYTVHSLEMIKSNYMCNDAEYNVILSDELSAWNVGYQEEVLMSDSLSASLNSLSNSEDSSPGTRLRQRRHTLPLESKIKKRSRGRPAKYLPDLANEHLSDEQLAEAKKKRQTAAVRSSRQKDKFEKDAILNALHVCLSDIKNNLCEHCHHQFEVLPMNLQQIVRNQMERRKRAQIKQQ